MLDTLLKLYDSLFPPHESIRYLKHETPEDFIKHFYPHAFVNNVALSDYSNPIIKAAIIANKFHDSTKAATLLSTLVDHWFKTLPERPTIFIPIPLSAARKRKRGYNQVSRVLESSQQKYNIEELLIRKKHTQPQTSLGRDRRFENVGEAFAFAGPKKTLPGIRIVIIDDVVTTGATMHAAYTTLSSNLADDSEIICLALAH